MTVTALGTPVTAGAFDASQPRLRPAVGATRLTRQLGGRPERDDLYSMGRWRPPAARRKYSAFGAIQAGGGTRQPSPTVTATIGM